MIDTHWMEHAGQSLVFFLLMSLGYYGGETLGLFPRLTIDAFTVTTTSNSTLIPICYSIYDGNITYGMNTTLTSNQTTIRYGWDVHVLFACAFGFYVCIFGALAIVKKLMHL